MKNIATVFATLAICMTAFTTAHARFLAMPVPKYMPQVQMEPEKKDEEKPAPQEKSLKKDKEQSNSLKNGKGDKKVSSDKNVAKVQK